MTTYYDTEKQFHFKMKIFIDFLMKRAVSFEVTYPDCLVTCIAVGKNNTSNICLKVHSNSFRQSSILHVYD
jgi:hypothetical protein